MTDIKINCACGQHYVFAVEPKDGKMRMPVNCPACGKDGTKAANDQIAQAAVLLPVKKSAPPKKIDKKTLTVAALVLFNVLVVAGIGYWYKHREDETSVAEILQQPRPAPAKLDNGTAKPEKIRIPRDPNAPHYPPGTTNVGVGMLVYKKAELNKFVVGHIFPRSPARKTEIRVNDILNKVDGQPVDEKTLGQVANLIMGAPDTSVTLEIINHNSGETNQIQITRALF